VEFVHGCITVELAKHFIEFEGTGCGVLLPMGISRSGSATAGNVPRPHTRQARAFTT
jgi:hypothetical protein